MFSCLALSCELDKYVAFRFDKYESNNCPEKLTLCHSGHLTCLEPGKLLRNHLIEHR